MLRQREAIDVVKGIDAETIECIREGLKEDLYFVAGINAAVQANAFGLSNEYSKAVHTG